MKLGFEESQSSYTSGSQNARAWTEAWVSAWAYCPHCGARHSSPVDSDDLTILIERDGSEFVVLRSPETAEHDPDYAEVDRFPTRAKAEEFRFGERA